MSHYVNFKEAHEALQAGREIVCVSTQENIVLKDSRNAVYINFGSMSLESFSERYCDERFILKKKNHNPCSDTRITNTNSRFFKGTQYKRR